MTTANSSKKPRSHQKASISSRVPVFLSGLCPPVSFQGFSLLGRKPGDPSSLQPVGHHLTAFTGKELCVRLEYQNPSVLGIVLTSVLCGLDIRTGVVVGLSVVCLSLFSFCLLFKI